eukprot:TRINITY_DN4060_c0_g1_i15.p1 TRINITY_DN4060_c0_g1~~TRINITY_DN4060_c0_g1_i15.p1  ORF type:complete len:134 (-),score=20.91 TRINITY_DN4060_c0_g1_i15:45-446(-)
MTSKASEKDEFMWFNISGLIGTALFYVLYEIVIQLLPFENYKVTVAWSLSYLISIIWQHKLHRVLVFGDDAPYWSSLVMTYISYSFSILLSNVIMFVMEMLGVNYKIAWGVNIVATGLLNYYSMKNTMKVSTN